MGASLQACGRLCGGDNAAPEKRLRDSTPSLKTQPNSCTSTSDACEPSPEQKVQASPICPSIPEKTSSGPTTLDVVPEGDGECMGGSAPICPPPPEKTSSGPITLDVLQGEWQGGNGAKILVTGVNVALNGLPLAMHQVELFEDGTVSGIGRLWQMYGWGADGGLEFVAANSRENMEFGSKVVWTRADKSEPWEEKMRLLGYAGSSKCVLSRGIEGCMPGTLDQKTEKKSNDAEDLEILQTLLTQWREPGLHSVRSCQVVPDLTNRDGTGVGVELVHFVALSMREKGFQKRRGTKGHDIPVVTREPPRSAFYATALAAWKEKVAEDEGFPPVRIESEQEMFTSLGNGHFFQALNLYDCG